MDPRLKAEDDRKTARARPHVSLPSASVVIARPHMSLPEPHMSLPEPHMSLPGLTGQSTPHNASSVNWPVRAENCTKAVCTSTCTRALRPL